ncbi:hypothetical protein [Cellulomonas endophytica]|uniref:hypothetical protein n=1 Tax=Cellulomonas endophytica TaxID=2494735 RepID=UPI001012A438|nr:hypothetical protein [Cellulomonas endophytica]
MGVLTRSVVLGLAAGGRSSTGFAVPALAAVRGRPGAGPALVRLLAGAAVLGETVADKLPATPSRLLPPVLTARVASGALGAVGLSVVEGRRTGAHLVALLAGGVGGWLGSVGGSTWRTWADGSGPDALRPDWRAALVEDAVVLRAAQGLVESSDRRRRRPRVAVLYAQPADEAYGHS